MEVIKHEYMEVKQVIIMYYIVYIELLSHKNIIATPITPWQFYAIILLPTFLNNMN